MAAFPSTRWLVAQRAAQGSKTLRVEYVVAYGRAVFLRLLADRKTSQAEGRTHAGADGRRQGDSDGGWRRVTRLLRASLGTASGLGKRAVDQGTAFKRQLRSVLPPVEGTSLVTGDDDGIMSVKTTPTGRAWRAGPIRGQTPTGRWEDIRRAVERAVSQGELSWVRSPVMRKVRHRVLD